MKQTTKNILKAYSMFFMGGILVSFGLGLFLPYWLAGGIVSVITAYVIHKEIKRM